MLSCHIAIKTGVSPRNGLRRILRRLKLSGLGDGNVIVLLLGRRILDGKAGVKGEGYLSKPSGISLLRDQSVEYSCSVVVALLSLSNQHP